MIALIGRALLALLCAMTAPRPPIPDLPPIQPRPEPPPHRVGLCLQCVKLPRKGGSWFCGDICQRDWTAEKNHAIPLEPALPTLLDGSPAARF